MNTHLVKTYGTPEDIEFFEGMFTNFNIFEVIEYADLITRTHFDKEWLWEQTEMYSTNKYFDTIIDTKKPDNIADGDASDSLRANLAKRYQNATVIGNLAFLALESKFNALEILKDIDQYLTYNNLPVKVPQRLSDFDFDINVEMRDLRDGPPDVNIFDNRYARRGTDYGVTREKLYNFGHALFPNENIIVDGFEKYTKNINVTQFISNVNRGYTYINSRMEMTAICGSLLRQ